MVLQSNGHVVMNNGHGVERGYYRVTVMVLQSNGHVVMNNGHVVMHDSHSTPELLHFCYNVVTRLSHASSV
jgi:hypothetical protein